MKKTITYPTQGTCSQAIILTVEEDTICQVSFVGGCHGNTQGVAALVQGMKIEEAIARLEGIAIKPSAETTCGLCRGGAKSSCRRQVKVECFLSCFPPLNKNMGDSLNRWLSPFLLS